eukprot:comp17765_c0_seq1/m.17793 comp17765_c0_seq1/g.17793  ORF comp17765_c0_seq1/g.17793 comp17765_c0_seq1/m.17793 type:complete len:787 (-) comp17765_c0_seq1:308-2668(-)
MKPAQRTALIAVGVAAGVVLFITWWRRKKEGPKSPCETAGPLMQTHIYVDEGNAYLDTFEPNGVEEGVEKDVFQREIAAAKEHAPVIVPLDSLEQVMQWQPGRDPFNVAWTPLQPRLSKGAPSGDSSGRVRKLLVCHDMRGGYTGLDRYAQGSDTELSYRIYHWDCVDTFVYFSHRFVSIPPPCWINAAHAHGVPVLGTIITEWEHGAHLCREFLHLKSTYEEFADRLVEMAHEYMFDGWLINIENPIAPDRVDDLRSFVAYLTEQMHDRLPGSKVIWYDSVTSEGKLHWQNQLNQLNMGFFEASDGIFLNYTWKPEGLDQSVLCAGSRADDVYVGVDVFGRGCPGGGGFNSCAAMALIGQRDLSAALFAPGYVYECLKPSNFHIEQLRFWRLLQPYCQRHPISFLPFDTSFNIGAGNSFYLDGKVVREDCWTDISQQTPWVTEGLGDVGALGWVESIDTNIDTTIAYNGGSCLQVSYTWDTSRHAGAPCEDARVRLFTTHISLGTDLVVGVTVANDQSAPVPVALALEMVSNGLTNRLELRPDASLQHVDCRDALWPEFVEPDHLVRLIRPSPDGDETHPYVHYKTETRDLWTTYSFVVARQYGCTIAGIDLMLGPPVRGSGVGGKGRVLVGELQVYPTMLQDVHASLTDLHPIQTAMSTSLFSLPPTDNSDRRAPHRYFKLLNAALTWGVIGMKIQPADKKGPRKRTSLQARTPAYFNIYVAPGRHEELTQQFQHVGRAYNTCYRLCGLRVADSLDGVTVAVEAVMPSGIRRREGVACTYIRCR